jgi:hypothetical protein
MKKTLLLAFTAFFAGGAAGFAAGGLRGFDKGMALILNGALAKDARDISTRIAILGHVRAGEQKPAIEKLETGLDDLLIGFDPAEPYPGLEPQTAGALRKAIDEAKAYRQAHPWAEEKSMRANMVRAMFAKDLYR